VESRCVFLVAETSRLEALQRLRARLDPLYGKVPPHVTLVFPFEPEASLEPLMARMRSLAHRLPIPFSLGLPDSREGTLFFPLVLGRSETQLLHEKLYACLPPGRLPNLAYRPHLTVGKVPAGRAAARAFRDAERLLPCTGALTHLVLERIGPEGESLVEVRIPE
jgi:2'-5' RNA ligase